MEVCWLVLQALVEVYGGDAWTGLSYPLLQVCLQLADTHRATKRGLHTMTQIHVGSHSMSSIYLPSTRGERENWLLVPFLWEEGAAQRRGKHQARRKRRRDISRTCHSITCISIIAIKIIIQPGALKQQTEKRTGLHFTF